LVDLPKDITAGVLKHAPPPQPEINIKKRVFDHFEDREVIERVARMINEAERPIFYVGQGVIQAGASELVRQIAKAA